jgi:hypothetical protein
MQQHICNNITHTKNQKPQDYSFGSILVAKNVARIASKMADTMSALAPSRDVSHMYMS